MPDLGHILIIVLAVLALIAGAALLTVFAIRLALNARKPKTDAVSAYVANFVAAPPPPQGAPLAGAAPALAPPQGLPRAGYAPGPVAPTPRRRVGKGSVVGLVAGGVVTALAIGCLVAVNVGAGAGATVVGFPDTAKTALASTRQQYQYTAPMKVDQHSELTIPVNYDVTPYLDHGPNSLSDAGAHQGEAVRVWGDPALTQATNVNVTATDSHTFELEPQAPYFVDLGHKTDLYFGVKDGKNQALPLSWGLYRTYYLARYLDKDGHKLAAPLVTRIDVNPDSATRPGTPRVTWALDENGHLQLRWSKADGATHYYIYVRSWGAKDQQAHPDDQIIGRTAKTDWDSTQAYTGPAIIGNYADDPMFENQVLVGALGAHGSANDKDANSHFTVGVIAADKDDNLSFVDAIDNDSFLDQVPSSIDTDDPSWKAGQGESGFKADDIPLTVPFRGVSGRITQRAPLVDEETSNKYHYLYLYIPGSTLKVNVFIDDYDLTAHHWDSFLAGQVARYQAAYPKGGNPAGSKNIVPALSPQQIADDKTPAASDLPKTPWPIHGVNAASKIIAANMSIGKTKIDLNKYIDRTPYALSDILNDAQTQNPYVIDVQAVGIEGGIMSVKYSASADQIKAENARVFAKAKQVVTQTVTKGMSDRDKAKALNDYLVANASYDYDALAAMGPNSYGPVPSKYAYAWKAGGILLQGRGVCASYAQAYQALSDVAGLKTVSVTGDAPTPHEWNKTYMDGKWQIVDVTWDDSDTAPNALFGITDREASTKYQHFEHSDWTIASDVGTYAAN